MFGTAKSELELSDISDLTVDMQQFKDHYYEFKASFNELLHSAFDSPRSRCNSPPSSISQGNILHNGNSHIRLQTIALPTFESDTCS